MSTDPPIALSPATLEDQAFLLSLRNHPTVAEQSFTGPVDPAGHLAWLADKLKNQLAAILIATERGIQVGMGRLDATGTWNGGEWHYEVEIGVAVCPEAHGRGIGTEIIRQLTREAAVRWPKCWLFARIRDDNHASRGAFLKAGFTIDNVSDNIVTMIREAKTDFR